MTIHDLWFCSGSPQAAFRLRRESPDDSKVLASQPQAITEKDCENYLRLRASQPPIPDKEREKRWCSTR